MALTFARSDIVNALVRDAGLTRPQAIEFLECMLEMLGDFLAQGETVKVSSFGSFCVRHKGERMGRNPKTKEEVMIAARRTLTFKPSHCLKENVQEYPVKVSVAV